MKNQGNIPYGRQWISDDDKSAILEVLESDFLTQGPAGPRFETAVAERVGAAASVSANSATSALHMACDALGLGAGDLLWTTPITFVATANCARYCGADVDFVDIDPITLNMSPKALADKLESSKKIGKLPKVIVPVHLTGEPCDMEAIGRLAKQYGVGVIEDASHAIGARYKGTEIGSCKYSDITVFSFHPVKVITTAEGGMAVTNDQQLAQKMELLRSHGVTRDPDLMTNQPDGPWYYQQISLGWNYRMTELQSALGISQLKRLDSFLNRRHEIADRYDELMRELPITLPTRSEEAYSALHLYVVRIPKRHGVASRIDVFNRMRSEGVLVNLHYIPVHLQPYYRNLGFSDEMFPNAERYYREALSIPIFPKMTGDEQGRVVDVLREALKP